VLGSAENPEACALTPALLAQIDVVLDFTTPAAVLVNLRALLPLGACVVAGTTGWHAALPAMKELAEQHEASLLHGTNFSLGVQAFFRAARELAQSLPGYELRIEETHHITKRDAPSGTALTLKQVVEQVSQEQTQIISHREGDASGLHVLTLSSPEETLTLQHESFSRLGFATGAVRAAEWLLAQLAPGVWEFGEVAPLLR
jgi:4-hydroxy-tetrahydrodipicolinate reductase